jgi:hypothetical protein
MTMQRSALYTGPTPQDLDRIPEDLKPLPQWVLWRGADRIDQQTGEVKLNKIPIDPQTLRNADTTDPTTWGTFEQCVAALPVALEEWESDDSGASRGGGIGFPIAIAQNKSAKSSSLLDTSITPLKTLGIFMWPTTYNHALPRSSSAPVAPPMPNGACP